jgi:hypothetical protein
MRKGPIYLLLAAFVSDLATAFAAGLVQERVEKREEFARVQCPTDHLVYFRTFIFRFVSFQLIPYKLDNPPEFCLLVSDQSFGGERSIRLE